MKKPLLSFLLFASYTITAQTDYSFVYNADSIIKKGVRLYEQKNYSESITQYLKVNVLDPKYPTAQYEIAMSLFAMAKKDSLNSHFDKLYKNDMMKKLPTLYTLYGSYLSDEKKYPESESIFKEGLQYVPNSSNHLYNLAILYYRKADYQKCIDVLEKIIAQNPNHASSHYLLGLLALESGKIIEGSMSMLAYLTIAPQGKFAKEAVLKLNAKFGENYLEKKNYVFSKNGDNFEELETILRNQLPLHHNYKIDSIIDQVITRQVQAILEYSQSHKMENGFFETVYTPWLKSIADQKQIEGFSDYILLSVQDNLGKKLTSQKKKIDEFSENYLAKDFWKYFAKRKLDIFGTEKEVVVYNENNIPHLLGEEINGKREGRYKVLNKDENLYADLQFENNILNGVQKYYNEEGKLDEEKTFFKGKLEGKRTVYYPNGNINFEENYKDGILDGKTVYYNFTGGINCEGTFSNGELNGSLVYFYPNGSKKSEANYVDGKQEGAQTNYNETGDIMLTSNYVSGKLAGKYIKYFDGKNIEEVAEYFDGNVIGSYKKYYSNKNLQAEYTYKDKKLALVTEYYPTGVKSSESTYNENGNLISTIYFDGLGEKYYEELFNSKEIKSVNQYTRNNPKPIEINVAKKSFEIKTLDNEVLISGAFEKGKRHGEWKNIQPTGRLKWTGVYEKGNQIGLSKNYANNGTLQSASYYVNDTLHGRNDFFDFRGLAKTYSYSKGDLNGPFKIFYPDGKIETEGIYKNDVLSEKRRTYYQTGKLFIEETCFNNIVTSKDIYNNKGEKEATIAYSNKTGTFTHPLNAGLIIQSYALKNGIFDGFYTQKDKYNNPIFEKEYKNGVLVGTCKLYGPTNALLKEQNYYNGKIHGMEKKYDVAGNLRMTSEYTFGDENGKTIRYFHNKSKLYEYTQKGDVKEGEFIYYNLKGEALVAITYLNDIPLFYVKKSKSGELNDKVMLLNHSGNILSNYPNGKIAIQFTFDKGSKEGNFIINNEQGKPEYVSFFKNDLLENERIEYYSNGNVYLKENFKSSDYEGLQEYFKEDGKPWIKAEYQNDELHGKTQIFSNGELATTKKYDSDFLVEIIK